MDGLSRRERQIMDVIYKKGQATSAADVLGALPDAPSYSTVRALLRILEEKGHLQHRYQGPRYVFWPTLPRSKARRSALMASALIDFGLSPEELDELKAQIEQARKEGR